MNEWVEDWYHATYNGAPEDGSAWVIPTDSLRGVRGGSWLYDYTGYLRASARSYGTPTSWLNFLGFRCAMSVP